MPRKLLGRGTGTSFQETSARLREAFIHVSFPEAFLVYVCVSGRISNTAHRGSQKSSFLDDVGHPNYRDYGGLLYPFT